MISQQIQGSTRGTIQPLHLHTERAIMRLNGSGLDLKWHEETYNITWIPEINSITMVEFHSPETLSKESIAS